MTHPKFQRQGLFVELATRAYQHVTDREGRLDLVGIPGSNSYHGLVNRLGWRNIHTFRYAVLARGWARMRRLWNRSPGLDLEIAPRMDHELKAYLLDRRPSPRPIANKFSPEYFDWKVFGHRLNSFKVVKARRDGRLIGLCVFAFHAKDRPFLYWLDCQSAKGLEQFVSATTDYLFRTTGRTVVYTWQPLEPNLAAALRRIGFLTNPFPEGPFSYRVPLCVRSQGSGATGIDWLDIDNFDFQPISQD